ncbi:hypothetical protein ACFWVC_32155 [Streptomyces sp. NPDC058691]|uniref:hypothetical protein n=1 Tax=Streptomyces sp. NPDC058691 TaxID=3346601 RepID=UPI00365FA328
MTAVAVEIMPGPPPEADPQGTTTPPLGAQLPGAIGDDEVIFIGDLDKVLDAASCSCTAGDDNAY